MEEPIEQNQHDNQPNGDLIDLNRSTRSRSTSGGLPELREIRRNNTPVNAIPIVNGLPNGLGRGHGPSAPPGIRIEVPNLIRPQPDGQQALRRPVIHNIPADDLIQEINAIERRARRDRQRREQHDFLLRMMERAEYRPRGVDPIRPITRPTGRRNPVANDIDPDPMQELTYQMSTLTNEFRNLRDALQNLTNSLYTNSEANTANSEQLARIAQSNEEILDGINE